MFTPESGGPEIEFAYGNVPLPPSVRPLVVLEGSDYEMGFQFYQQLIAIFGPWVLDRVKYDGASGADLDLVAANQRHVADWAPEILEMLRGMADGATKAGYDLAYEQVLGHFLKDRRRQLERPVDCSGFAAWGRATRDGRLIASGCGDHQLTFEVTIAAFPDTGNNFIISPLGDFGPAEFGNIGGHPGMNDKGLAYTHHGATHWIKARPESEWADGVPEGIAIFHTLRFAGSAKEALEMQLCYPSSNGFVGGFWADTSGDAFVIESRENPRAIRRAGDCGETDFLYATNNALHKDLGHCQASPTKGTTYIPHGGWLGTGTTISSVPRNLEIWDMLHHYNGSVDLDFATMMWRFASRAPLYDTLEEADAAYYRTQGAGWDQKIGNLNNAAVGIMQPDAGHEGLYHVANGAVARRAYPHAPHNHFYRIAPTYSFYQLKLTADPESMAREARDRAQYELYYANQELRKLSYGDVAYAPLDALFDRAATEWHVARYFFDLTTMTRADGNARTYGLAKALRSYARCQALARQVQHALLPPAVNPEGLGLLPWGHWAAAKTPEASGV